MIMRLDGMTRSAAALIGLCAIAATGLTASCFSERATATILTIDPALCTGSRPPNVVIIRGFAFEPTELRVAPGTEVMWANCEPAGTEAHTSTSDGAAWNSGLLPPLNGYARTFSQTGSFPYHCEPHPFMQATIVVQ
ncbi:MAG: plastocyanin/azurin family copper-binding protein [Gemmatimonadota bacterium]|nr:plastocyanin/azurin family copper-binding protein [Gemmatimonadota bacterium]